MNGWVGMLWMLFMLAGMVWFASVLFVTLIAPFATRSTLAPGVRARRALLLAAMPLAATFATVAAVSALAVAKPLDWIADHCAYHGPGHPHLCFEHLPAIVIPPLHVGLFIAALLIAVIVVARFTMHARSFTARLCALSGMASGRSVRVIDTAQPFAFAASVGAPFVMMSRGLIEKLSLRERRIVMAHEASHLRNGDLAWNRLFEILLLLNPFSTRLRNTWRQALEERADDMVAARYGNDAVAATISKMLRFTSNHYAAAFSATGADAVRRVRRLVVGENSVNVLPVFEVALVAALVMLAIVTGGAHHALETLLGHFLGA